MVARPLFGGAISCEIPAGWVDVSEMRQVPDNQECWIRHGANDSESMFVVEILELQTDVSNSEAASFFFRDLAESNEVSSTAGRRFTPLPPQSPPALLVHAGLPPDAVMCCGTGQQKVVAGNRRDAGDPWVNIEVCVLRLPGVTSDILLTFTTPNEQGGNLREALSEPFLQALNSVRVVDWTLFG
jgi:hypothetical protein